MQAAQLFASRAAIGWFDLAVAAAAAAARAPAHDKRWRAAAAAAWARLPAIAGGANLNARRGRTGASPAIATRLATWAQLATPLADAHPQRVSGHGHGARVRSTAWRIVEHQLRRAATGGTVGRRRYRARWRPDAAGAVHAARISMRWRSSRAGLLATAATCWSAGNPDNAASGAASGRVRTLDPRRWGALGRGGGRRPGFVACPGAGAARRARTSSSRDRTRRDGERHRLFPEELT
jgi:hypothetical protein